MYKKRRSRSRKKSRKVARVSATRRRSKSPKGSRKVAHVSATRRRSKSPKGSRKVARVSATRRRSKSPKGSPKGSRKVARKVARVSAKRKKSRRVARRRTRTGATRKLKMGFEGYEGYSFVFFAVQDIDYPKIDQEALEIVEQADKEVTIGDLLDWDYEYDRDDLTDQLLDWFTKKVKNIIREEVSKTDDIDKIIENVDERIKPLSKNIYFSGNGELSTLYSLSKHRVEDDILFAHKTKGFEFED